MDRQECLSHQKVRIIAENGGTDIPVCALIALADTVPESPTPGFDGFMKHIK